MQSYSQLTQGERHSIWVLRKDHLGPTAIGAKLGRSPSTISREIRRNQGGCGYRWQQAQRLAAGRRAHTRRARKLTDARRAWIQARLREDWSPEQIAGRSRKSLGISISHETIYALVRKDRAQGGKLWRHLRIIGGKRRRRRRGSKATDGRGKIPGRVSIAERPEAVAKRTRYGDWEGDLVQGAGSSGFLLSCLERKSRIVRLARLGSKRADEVETAIMERLVGWKTLTITVDNGKEFAGHQRFATALEASAYFCEPYRSWEKGAVENVNGLIRQYAPKGMDFRELSEDRVREIERRLNARPRKCLGWKRPCDFERFLRE